MGNKKGRLSAKFVEKKPKMWIYGDTSRPCISEMSVAFAIFAGKHPVQEMD